MIAKPTQSVESVASTPLAPTLTALTLARIVVTGSRRFPYVILTPMAAALGVPRSTLESALSLQWAVGALSPLAGSPIERLGRKRVMLFGMALLSGSAAVAALGQGFGVVLLAIVIGGLGKMIYDPAMQAYIGDRVPYARRGMAIGVTELSWSASLVIFGPLAALLISQVSLYAIYAVIAVGGAFSFALLAWLLPGDAPPVHPDATRPKNPANFRLLLTSRAALALLIAGALSSVASELINIAYESWLLNAFALTTVALGILSWAISAAEVTGEVFVIGAADRIGKRRLTVLTMAATGAAYFALPLTTGNLPAAIVALFLMFLLFETSIVVMIPLATEVLPGARGMMMSSNVAALATGRALGTLTGGWLLRTGGFGFNGVIAAILNIVAAILIWRFVLIDSPDE